MTSSIQWCKPAEATGSRHMSVVFNDDVRGCAWLVSRIDLGAQVMLLMARCENGLRVLRILDMRIKDLKNEP